MIHRSPTTRLMFQCDHGQVWPIVNVDLKCSEIYYVGLFSFSLWINLIQPECCCMWSCLRFQSTVQRTTSPAVNGGAVEVSAIKWCASAPFRWTSNTGLSFINPMSHGLQIYSNGSMGFTLNNGCLCDGNWWYAHLSTTFGKQNSIFQNDIISIDQFFLPVIILLLQWFRLANYNFRLKL